MSAADSQSACTNTHYIKKTGGVKKGLCQQGLSLSLSLCWYVNLGSLSMSVSSTTKLTVCDDDAYISLTRTQLPRATNKRNNIRKTD